jgi:hypothetical protein
MKHQMSAQQSDSLSYVILGLITGSMQYFRSINLNIHLLSMEWAITALHAGITGAFCGGMGWVGKKIAEVGYNYIIQYLRNRKSNKTNSNEKIS